MRVCFIGHRNIEKTESLIDAVKETILFLLSKGVSTFLFGSKSAFDELSLEIVSKLKKDFPFIKRIYVRAVYPYIDKSYEEYLLKYYDETYFPPSLKNAGKSSYVRRNYEMIDSSTYCVFYYNENYILPSKLKTISRPKSGTKIAYEYALKNGKHIINLYKKSNV